MREPVWDVVVVGAGSVGTPAALELAEEGANVLVLDELPGPGQGSNKAAIGGVRATFSDPAKVAVCGRSLEILGTWREDRGDDLEWRRGGYVFVAYREAEEKTLRALVETQRGLGLDVSWLDAPDLLRIVPDLERRDLRGGTFSPRDGHLSPLLAQQAFHRHAVKAGAVFRFLERVVGFRREGDTVTGVVTPSGTHAAKTVLLAAGHRAPELGKLAGLTLPVRPDEHEAGISEPVAPFLGPLVVDLRPGPGSANVYFYQHATGQVVFCLTPSPPVWGDDTRETSDFLPQVASRLLAVCPRLAGLRVRRTWRGLYPMTPDGNPLVGWAPGVSGLFLAVGMCGQGFMIGPGLAETLSRVLLSQDGWGRATPADALILDKWSPVRPFATGETLR